jgi:putative ABC transport system permease protein
MAIITISCVSVLLFAAFVESIFWGVRESVIHSQTGHLQIFHKDYLANKVVSPFKYLIDKPRAVERIASDLPGVRVVTPRLHFSGIAGNGDASAVFIGVGVDPEQEPLISTFSRIVKGSDLELDDNDGALMGQGIGQAVGAKPGDTLLLMARTENGGLNGVDATARGFFQTDSVEYDDRGIKIPMSLAQRLLQTEGVSSLAVLLSDTDKTDATAAQLRARFAQENLPLDVRTWHDLNPTYDKIVNLYQRIFFFLTAVVTAVVIVSVSNTMMLSVTERIRELGIMRAIGMRSRGIATMLLVEGALLGVVGSVLGVAAGTGLIQFSNRVLGGIQMPPPPGSSRGFALILPTNTTVDLVIVGVAIVIAALATLPPAIKAARLNVANAINHL